LLRSVDTPDPGLEADVVDVGLGRPDDFERVGEALRGRIALVRHEYPFMPDHLHRRRKYDLARARGAAGFLIANPWDGGGLMSGSSGRTRDDDGIPAAYIDHATCERLSRAAAIGMARVRLVIQGKELLDALAGIVVLDLPGRSEDRIVLSAHVDGHDLGASALDNATGVAVVMATARALAPHVAACPRGLRICLFSAEEWALAGSARYLADLDARQRSRFKLNLNLDTVGGSSRLTALVSGFKALQHFVQTTSGAAGQVVDSWLPLAPNSDHANFAALGIPALRLVAGFGEPDSNVRFILSAGDLPEVVDESELRSALRVACSMAWRGLTMSPDDIDALADRQARVATTNSLGNGSTTVPSSSAG
jgi:hypothetical protein